MREDCKFFQRRTYRSGDVASFCALGLAPEAPWRCPEGCRRYETRVGEPTRPTPQEQTPTGPELHPDAAALLGSAEEIIGALAPELAAEEQRRARARQEAEDSWWSRLRRSPRWRR
jgi:hypothetical protein